MEDVGAEPGSVCVLSTFNSVLPDKNICQRIILSCIFFLKILTELGGFEVKESKFRREMEKLRNQQSRDLSLEVKVFRFSNTINIVCHLGSLKTVIKIMFHV